MSLFYKTILFILICSGVFPKSASGGEPEYLFSYFVERGKDGLHLAHSSDGLNWTALNDGKSLLVPKVGKDKLMRDPSIVRGPDGRFHMVWTTGWWDKHIGYASSVDLVNWSEQKSIPVMEHEPTARNSWAPELYYDDLNQEFLIFWASTIPGRHSEVAESEREKGLNHRIYYTRTKDFETFAPTAIFFNPDFSAIDSALLQYGSEYVMFVKNENPNPPEKNIRITRSENAAGPYPTIVSEPITGNYWAEGPTPLQVGDYTYVYFDKYREHRYGAVRSKDLKEWEDVSDQVSFPSGIRHGTAFTVDSEVVAQLKQKKAKKNNADGPSRSGIEEKDFVAYLFTYFTGNRPADEAVRFAVSTDGLNYRALNGNRPVIDSAAVSSSGGVRDPHLLRGEDGCSFYMVCTDMVTSKGWDSNRAFVMLKSTDLLNWTSSVVNIEEKYAGQEELKRVWAPQTIFDPEAGKYMLYWSMKHGDANDIIYYAYANEDFTDIEGEPRPLFIPQSGDLCIDADIIFKDGLFHLFCKSDTPARKGIRLATSPSLTSGAWKEHEGFMESTNEDVEGSGIFKLNHSDEYILMYDMYRKHRYQFTRSSDLKNFSVIDDEISMDFQPRHGTILPITRNELNTLLENWGTPEGFSGINHNPVIPGYYADPDILYCEQDGKYYLYPTSDGFENWMGTYFETFSSENLVDWKNEGVILDLKKNVSWADKKAWAPSIIERKFDGKFRYFYYFTAEGKIGVATADKPTGPFVDSGKPLIDFKPEGINYGIEIDPEVFHDPQSGKYYFYWGNGYLAVAELNEDMISIKRDTLKVITPPRTFREGVTVFFRKGKYYFLWSENDTRSADYRVRYAVSSSPTGPLEISEDNLVIAKDAAKGLYGTGHNSVIQVPGRDEWYIVYHRFSYPNGIKMGRSAGYHRETCIDRMEFDAIGKILRVNPSHAGIAPLK